MEPSIAYALIAVAFVVGYLFGRGKSPESSPAPVAPDPEVLEAVRPILEAEGMIAAIKAYRERTGVGLRDAKLAVETLQRP
jgi:ribosomal protein L7/L12